MRLFRFDFLSVLLLAVIVVLGLSLALISYNMVMGKPIVDSLGPFATLFSMVFTGIGVGSELFRRRKKEFSLQQTEDVLELKAQEELNRVEDKIYRNLNSDYNDFV